MLITKLQTNSNQHFFYVPNRLIDLILFQNLPLFLTFLMFFLFPGYLLQNSEKTHATITSPAIGGSTSTERTT